MVPDDAGVVTLLHLQRHIAALNATPCDVMGHAGIKKLDMLPAGVDGRKACESVGISSPDGEYLPLVAPVVTEGRPEEWLNRAEEAMFLTTKRHLFKVLEDSKG